MTEREYEFGPLAGMVPLAVEPGVSVAAGRARSEFVSSAGVRWSRSAARNPRTWSGAMSLQTKGAARLLDLAAHSPATPFFLYDRECARRNLLPARDCFGVPATRTNLIPNPSWESGLNQAGSAPSAETGITATWATDWSERGTRSAKVAFGSGSHNSSGFSLLGAPVGSMARVGVVPGRTYTLGVTLRFGDITHPQGFTPESTIFSVRLWATIPLGEGKASTSRGFPTRDQVVRLVFSFTVPDDATDIALRLASGGFATATLWVDSMTLEEGVTDGSYFDGATAGYAWAGTANSSASVPSMVTVAGVPMPPVEWASKRAYVLAGRTYTLSAWTTGTASPLSYQAPGKTLTALPAPVGGLSQATFTPTASGVVTITRAAARVVSGVRLHEGAPDGTFYSSEGTPCRVSVPDVGRTHQLVTGAETRTDYEVTLEEIGVTTF